MITHSSSCSSTYSLVSSRLYLYRVKKYGATFLELFLLFFELEGEEDLDGGLDVLYDDEGVDVLQLLSFFTQLLLVVVVDL